MRPSMRVVIATQEDPFYLPPALDSLCSAPALDVRALIVLPSFNEGLVPTARRLYEFYGPLDFSRLLVRWVGARAANAINRKVQVTRPYSAADVGRRHSVPVLVTPNINSPSFIATLRDEIRSDLLISVAASQIFKKELLGVPPLGCINLHSAPLPPYQGMMPNFWTMVNGEPEATVTVHYMVRKLDAGDIILQRPVPIEPRDSLHDLMVRSKVLGARALLEATAKMAAGAVQPIRMNPEEATYFSFPTRADSARLRQMGRRLL